MLELLLALRYLRKKKIVLLSIAAVSLSVSLLIVVSSLFTGFIDAFEQSAVEAMGDVVISPPMKFADYPVFIEMLEKTKAVDAASATLSCQGLVHLGKGNVRPVRIWGIQPARRARVTGFKRSLLKQGKLPSEPSFKVTGDAGKIGGFVGIGVVAEPNEETDEYDFSQIAGMIGKQVVLTTGTVSGEAGGKTPEVKRKTLKFIIADIVFTGVYYLDTNFIYLPIEKLQEKLYPGQDRPVADQVHIKLAEGVDVETALAEIRGIWQVFATDRLGWNATLTSLTDIETSQHLQSRYAAEIMKQMGVLLLIFGVVSFGVVLLVFCIFYMIVRLKQRDIAIMKSCGVSSISVASTFVAFGCCVGIIGIVLGTTLGCVVTRNINTIEDWIRIIFGLKLWKSSVYMFSKIPSEVNWHLALLIALSAIAAVAVGTLIPAIIAARTRPVDILRYE